VINPEEATKVRRIFTLYLELKNLLPVVEELPPKIIAGTKRCVMSEKLKPILVPLFSPVSSTTRVMIASLLFHSIGDGRLWSESVHS
jgi:hypothetical protein